MTRSPIAAVLLATATLTFHVGPVAAEVVVPGEFEVRQVYSGAPLSGISGLAIGQGSTLWLSDTGPVPHDGNQKIVRLDFLTGTASVLLEGLPLGTPARILVGDGVRYPLSSIIVADHNTEESRPCCDGRVFEINTDTTAIKVLSYGAPAISPPADPVGLAYAPGGGFGEGILVVDDEGWSLNTPLLFRINPDLSRTVFLQDPAIWTMDTLPMDIAFGPASFGGDLFVADPGFAVWPNWVESTPTIWRATAAAQLSAFLAGSPLVHPLAVRFAPGGPFGNDMYVLDAKHGSTSIYRIDATGTTAEFATGLPDVTLDTGSNGLPDMQFTADGKRLFVALAASVLEIKPISTHGELVGLTLKSPAVAGCLSVTGTVTLSGPAPAEGVVVTLSDTLVSASTPATLKIIAGATSKTFTVKTIPVLASESGTVSATLDGKTLSQDLTVRPMGLSSLTLSPTTVVGSQPSTGTAKLECKAGPGAVTVNLGSSEPSVAGPVAASISVPQTYQSATFDIVTNAVLAKTPVTISGTANGITKSKTLTVTSAASVSPTSLKFGNVVINTTSGVLSTTLYNRGAVPFAISSIGLTGTNAKYYAQTSDCAATLDAGASCVIGVTFTPTVTGIKSAKLGIATSATATPLSVSLSGAGVLP